MTTATLGLAVDSGPVAKATVDLDKLAPAAAKAEAAASKLTGTFDKAGASASTMADRVQRAAAMGGKTTEGYADAVTQAYGASSKFSDAQIATIRNYETQIGKSQLLSQGMGREAAQFESLRKAGTTGNTQYGQTVAGLAGQLYDLEKQQDKTSTGAARFADTLTRRLILGYAVSQIKGLVSSLIALNTELAKTGDIGKLTGAGSALTQGLTAAAGYKGIQGDAFASAMVAFNQQIPLAKAGVGSLGELLRANRVTVTDTADAFFKVADLVKNAGNDTARLSILQQAGLPATLQMAKLMGQGSEAIRKQAEEAGKLSDQQIKAAQDLDKKFNETWTNFETGAKRAFVNIMSGMGDLATWWQNKVGAMVDPKDLLAFNMKNGGGNRLTQSQADEFYGATGADQPGSPRTRIMITIPTVDAAVQKAIRQKQISDEQTLLSLYGSTTTATEARRQVELQFQAAALNGVAIDSKRAETLKQLAYDQNLGLTALRASADAYKIEAETIGMSTGEAAKYAAVQNAINDARRNGKVLSAEQIEQIKREADAMGKAAQRVDDLKFQYDTFSGTFRDFASNLRQGQNAWTAFGNAANSALNKIIDKLMDMATQQLWKAAFGGNGLEGIFSLFGTGTGTATYTPGPQGLNGLLGHNANGTDNWRGGPTWVGEQGPEIVNLPKGASVTSNKKIAAMMGAGGGTMGGQPVTVNIMNAPAGTSATSTSKRGPNGDVTVDVMLKRAVDDQGAALINSGESAMGKALEQRYGLSPRL